MSIASRTSRIAACMVLSGSACLPGLLHAGSSYGGGSSPASVGGGLEDIAEREIARRLALMEDAMTLIAEGDQLAGGQDYEGAIAKYRNAIDYLPDAPMTAERRQMALARYADASVELAHQRAKSGQYDEARKLCENVLSLDPEHAKARKLLADLGDPEIWNPALTADHVKDVQQVEELLTLAVSQYDLGQFDKSKETLQAVLRVDRYNSAARGLMEKITVNLTNDYYPAARSQTRADLMAEVDKAWETMVPPAGLRERIEDASGANEPTSKDFISAKLADIIIPRVQLTEATVEEAIEFLRMKSIELDPFETDPAEKGVNIILKGADTGVDAPSLSLDLANVPLAEALRYVTDLAGLKYKVEPYAVVVVPLTDISTELYTRVFRVPPDFIDSATGGDGGGDAVVDPFAPDAGGGGGSDLSARRSAKDILSERGITFPEGSSAYFSPQTSQLIVRNSQGNLDLIDAYVQDLRNRVQRQIHIMTKFIDISQKNTDELGFDWLLGAFNIGGERVFGNGGTVGNSSTGSVSGTDFPIVFPNGSPVGSNPISRGVRFGGNAISSDSIDDLIAAEDLVSSVSPGVFSLAGVFTDPQFQVVIRAISQKKGVDLMSAPSIVTRSGQRAQIEIIREFIYPTEFDPPEIPQEFGVVNIEDSGLDGNQGGVDSFPVTPTTPTAFETRSVGVTLEVDPVIGSDGYTIDLNLAPEVVEFEGFINYGSPIQAGATNPDGTPTTVVLTDNRIEQPVFSTRKVTTAVTIWDGQTVAIGGLIREDVQAVEDKIPILGDLPLIGRLFQTKAEQNFKRNLMMFVTARLIDPAGQPIRTFDEITGGAGDTGLTGG